MANKPINRSNEITKRMQEKRKTRKEKQISQKTNSNIVDLNPAVSIITLNVRDLNTAVKSRDCLIG